jgi:hypothetical protein
MSDAFSSPTGTQASPWFALRHDASTRKYNRHDHDEHDCGRPYEQPASTLEPADTFLNIDHYVWKSRHMDNHTTISALSALAQWTRLAVFCRLISHEPDGLPAHKNADALDVPHNTMSRHL